jgi:hypothetical protein
MNLKYLSLCLISIGLFGCSQQFVQKNKQQNTTLNQRASSGLNAIYETSSFDFKGQLLIRNTPSDIKITTGPKVEQQTAALSTDIKNKVNEVLRSQNIQLSNAEKKALYESLAQQSDPYSFLYSYGSGESKSTKFITGLLNFLNNFELSYDGSVHYRKKLATLNLNFQYEKPTLLVKAKVPMAIDFNQYKFYMNYFSLAPYLVNSEDQSAMAYLDFSKYKDVGEKFDFKAFVEYGKQMNAVNFLLAEPDSLENVSINAAEKQSGTVEKIQLRTNVTDLFYQNLFFDYVNEPYVFEKILGQKWTESAEEDAEAVDEHSSVYDEAEESDESNAIKSSERVFSLISEKFDQSDDIETVEVEEYSPDVEDGVAASKIYIGENDDDQYDDEDDEDQYDREIESLSEQACHALLNSKEQIPVGFVNLCQEDFDIDVLSTEKNQNQSHERDGEGVQGVISQLAQLQAIFKPYRSTELTDVFAFEKIWNQHQSEIQKILKENEFLAVPIRVTVSLDAQGRAQSIVYDAMKSDLKYGKTHVVSTTQFLNYGQATAIDTKVLKDAKSVKDVVKGSLLESVFSGVSSKLGLEDVEDAEDEYEASEALDMSTQQLQKLALDTYKRTGSYVKAYQVVFAMFYAAKEPEKFKYYSMKDMNEIAELHAYQFSSELDEPTGAAATRLEKLAEKHHLQQRSNFDYAGSIAANFVDTIIASEKDDQYWKKIKQQYKTKQSAFAAHYETLYKKRYDFSKQDAPLLAQASKIMAQSFMDDLNGKLSKKSIQSLKPAHEEFVDQFIYYRTYEDIVEHYK